ncbi:hypothetical protein HPB47_016432 [Ixodes persulcatus]|uniref:Uncharacterized protein n=1 Tax=Ixodes persulcatus TaxID=34615 RepID=A0AC60QQX1_IXOPE|nr:hypothetical protein HPB47_016432 [Ixodes persulcatus]
MKSVRNKLQKDMPSSLVDINNCNLHKVHNDFAKGLDAFGSDVEEVVRNVYYNFKSAVRAEALGECQEALGIASHVFLRHVSNRWLTLQDSLCRVLEQFEALKSYFHKASMTKQRVDTENLHSKLAAAFSKKDLYAKVLFLKNCAELFSRFQTLFQKQEPLLHILHAELLSLVQRILSRCLRSAAYVDKSAEELKKLDVQDSTLWKTKPEVGMDTEQAMLKWDPGEKKRLLLGARAFYLACSKDLLQKLPLDNKVLQHTSLLGLQPSDVESEVRSLRYLASQLPQVLESDHVSSLVDEWPLLRCDSANSLQLMEDGRIDTRWATVFKQKCAAGQQKYPLLSRLVKALLSLPHGNADCERGFSENKHLLEGRASLCIASINGLRQVKTYLQRYDGDATKVPLSPDLLRSADMKRKKPDSAQVDADNSHDKRLKKQLEERVISCRALLKRAEETIAAGLKCQSLEKVEGGQTILAEANATFSFLCKLLYEIQMFVTHTDIYIYIYMGGEVRLTRAALRILTTKKDNCFGDVSQVLLYLTDFNSFDFQAGHTSAQVCNTFSDQCDYHLICRDVSSTRAIDYPRICSKYLRRYYVTKKKLTCWEYYLLPRCSPRESTFQKIVFSFSFQGSFKPRTMADMDSLSLLKNPLSGLECGNVTRTTQLGNCHRACSQKVAPRTELMAIVTPPFLPQRILGELHRCFDFESNVSAASTSVPPPPPRKRFQRKTSSYSERYWALIPFLLQPFGMTSLKPHFYKVENWASWLTLYMMGWLRWMWATLSGWPTLRWCAIF